MFDLWSNLTWGSSDYPFDKNNTRLSQLIRDEEEKDLEETGLEPDELADRLLTQFPAYGTNATIYANSHQHDEDWLVEEEDEEGQGGEQQQRHYHSIHSSSAGNESSKLLQQSSFFLGDRTRLDLSVTLPTPAAGGAAGVGGTGSSKRSSPLLTNNNNAATDDWDFDEQFLWKAEGAEEQKTNQSDYYYARRNNNNNKGSTSYHPRQPLGLPQDGTTASRPHKQWIYGNNNTYFRPEVQEQQHATGAAASMPNPHATFETSALALGSRRPSFNSSTNRNKEAAANSSTTTNSSVQDFYNSRQHWMPDQLCKHCYACDTPFTVFRRRHHCRLCGQVFCSAYVSSSSSLIYISIYG
jgi:hypothetical protein